MHPFTFPKDNLPSLQIFCKGFDQNTSDFFFQSIKLPIFCNLEKCLWIQVKSNFTSKTISIFFVRYLHLIESLESVISFYCCKPRIASIATLIWATVLNNIFKRLTCRKPGRWKQSIAEFFGKVLLKTGLMSLMVLKHFVLKTNLWKKTLISSSLPVF